MSRETPQKVLFYVGISTELIAFFIRSKAIEGKITIANLLSRTEKLP